MRKLMFYAALLLCLVVMPVGVQAYTINDSPPNDSIGYPVYETYGINVSNIYSPGGFTINLFTNLPPAGNLVGSWMTTPADLFITEQYHGILYQWAIPTASRPGFNAGTLYAVGTFLVSDNFEPAGGGYVYNHNVPVQVATLGSNYGFSTIGSGSIQYFGPDASMPFYRYQITPGIYQDDPNGSFSFLWGTATCANDVITGRVPEPATMLLLGLGLVGIGLLRRKQS